MHNARCTFKHLASTHSPDAKDSLTFASSYYYYYYYYYYYRTFTNAVCLLFDKA